MRIGKKYYMAIAAGLLLVVTWFFFNSTLSSLPYGLWKSPITEQQVAQASVGYETMKIDPAHPETLYWSSVHPSEHGRSTVTRFIHGVAEACLPKPYSARSAVNAYGGGEFTVYDGAIYFSNESDHRLYRMADCGAPPVAITPPGKDHYADCSVDSAHHRLYCVREAVHDDQKVVQSIVQIGIKTGQIAVVAKGHDFYASPKINPAGNQLAWLSWDYPDMPWDSTSLWLADIDAVGHLSKARSILSKRDVSVFQPQWSPAGLLYFVADPSGWWNFYRYKNKKIELAYGDRVEFGLASFNLGVSTYGFIDEHTLAATYMHDGRGYLGAIDLNTKKMTTIDTPLTEFANIVSNPSGIYFFAGSPRKRVSVMHWDRATQNITTLSSATAETVDPAFISIPKHFTYPSTGGDIVHANYYPPTNTQYQSSVNATQETPPLIVLVHGGPTGRSNTVLNFEKLYWTSRGYAILDVDYRGSTGYGRAYRNALRGHWGIVDVDDVVAGAHYVVSKGWADPQRMIIKGWSSGGYTVLRALSTRHVFAAGTDYFGWNNLETARLNTDRFEAHYLDRNSRRLRQKR